MLVSQHEAVLGGCGADAFQDDRIGLRPSQRTYGGSLLDESSHQLRHLQTDYLRLARGLIGLIGLQKVASNRAGIFPVGSPVLLLNPVSLRKRYSVSDPGQSAHTQAKYAYTKS